MWICRSTWAGEQFRLPGFGKHQSKLKPGDLAYENGEWPAGIEKGFTFQQSFIAVALVGVEWVWPVHWEDATAS